VNTGSPPKKMATGIRAPVRNNGGHARADFLELPNACGVVVVNWMRYMPTLRSPVRGLGTTHGSVINLPGRAPAFLDGELSRVGQASCLSLKFFSKEERQAGSLSYGGADGHGSVRVGVASNFWIISLHGPSFTIFGFADANRAPASNLMASRSSWAAWPSSARRVRRRLRPQNSLPSHGHALVRTHRFDGNWKRRNLAVDGGFSTTAPCHVGRFHLAVGDFGDSSSVATGANAFSSPPCRGLDEIAE